MKPATFFTAVIAATVLMPVSAMANSSGYSGYNVPSTCNLADGSTCAPGPATEEIIPEYYNVPSKTQHIYYDRPSTQPVVTTIIHHVPTPVYGRETITEEIQGGPWTGPSLACCGQQQPIYQPAPPPPPVYQPAPPVYQPAPPVYMPAPMPAPTGLYCYSGSKSRYDYRGRRIKGSGCR